MLVYPGPELRVQAEPLLEQLREWLSTELLRRISAAAVTEHGQRVIPERALRSVGLGSEFDERTLELRVRVPPALRRTETVYLSGRGLPPDVTDTRAPDALSSYVNARAGEDFAFNSADHLNGRRPPRADFEAAINFRNWVLEGNATYTGSGIGAAAPTPWARGDVRVIRDAPERMIRFAAGDLAYPVTGYQRFRPLGGVTLASNFTLQPYRVTVPTNSNQIFLASSSRVVVWANGARVQTLYLPPGRHDLRNLALGNGVSEIRLEITDSVGRTEVVSFPWVSETDLLAPGLHQYSYSAGLPWISVNGRREYDSKLPTASAAHRLGFSDHLTAGAFFQGDHNQRVGGLELLHSTLLGTFALEPALSQVAGDHAHAAARLRYGYTDYRGPDHSQRNLTLGAENRAAHFATLEDLSANVVPDWDFSTSYSQSLFWGVSARVSADYQLNRKIAPDIANGHGAAAALVRGWPDGLQLSLTLSERKSQLGVLERGAFVLLSWAVPDSTHYLTASTDTARHASRVDWRYSSRQLVGGLNAGLGLERNPDNDHGDASFTYTGNRGTIDLTHNADANRSTRRVSQTTGARLGTALVFAGGRFAVGRPVTDSFAIVAPVSQISGQTVDVNPNSGEYYEARADWLGPGVVPNMRSYQYFHLYFDPSKLEPGYELGRENYDLLPSYKSGFLIPVGTDASILLAGTLVGPDGGPIRLESGEARLLGRPDAPPITLFTNRKGKFRMEGFRPGEYELRLFNEKWSPMRFRVPAKAFGVYDVGSLRAEPVKETR